MRRRSATRFALLGVLLFVLARTLATAPAPSEPRAADTDVETCSPRRPGARTRSRRSGRAGAPDPHMRFLNRDESSVASLYDQALGPACWKATWSCAAV
jgi:hypothetical protein